MASCPVCESTGVPVKKDGDLWKHDSPDGGKCPNINKVLHDTAGVLPESTTLVNNSEEVETVLTEDQLEHFSNVVSLTDLVKEDPRIFKFTLTVSNPCPYLTQNSWHEYNKDLAANRARQAGKNPTAEARYVGSVERGRKVVLTYEVPVK